MHLHPDELQDMQQETSNVGLDDHAHAIVQSPARADAPASLVGSKVSRDVIDIREALERSDLVVDDILVESNIAQNKRSSKDSSRVDSSNHRRSSAEEVTGEDSVLPSRAIKPVLRSHNGQASTLESDADLVLEKDNVDEDHIDPSLVNSHTAVLAEDALEGLIVEGDTDEMYLPRAKNVTDVVSTYADTSLSTVQYAFEPDMTENRTTVGSSDGTLHINSDQLSTSKHLESPSADRTDYSDDNLEAKMKQSDLPSAFQETVDDSKESVQDSSKTTELTSTSVPLKDANDSSILANEIDDSPSGSKWLRNSEAQRRTIRRLREPPRSLLRNVFAATAETTPSSRSSIERPSSSDRSHYTNQGIQLAEQDQFPDISYEQSFMPPDITDHITPEEMTATGPEPRRSMDSPHIAHASDVDAFVGVEEANHDNETPRRALKTLEQNTTNATDGSQLTPSGPNLKAWETPAATKQYMKEVPTRTAIARRVESFQIPPERLASLQPEIIAMQNQSRKQPEKLSLKESSAQIDALLNENWGLKMKIMFMDKHFETDRDKADVIAENVRLQTNGFNFVQQVKARDKTIRSLEKQVEQLELQNIKYEAARRTVPTEDTLDKINELEHYINVLEDEHDKVVNQMEISLQETRSKLQEAETRLYTDESLKSENYSSRSDNEYLVEELKESLAHAEQDIEDLEIEVEAQAKEFIHKLSERDQQFLEYREKLLHTADQLAIHEKELAECDKLRQEMIDKVRQVYETERLEYETYIEDRHEEIDNLKRAVNSYNQDSFEQRLAEALRPQEDAWKEINEQCEQLRVELRSRDEDYEAEIAYLEQELTRARDDKAQTDAVNHSLQAQLANHEGALLKFAESKREVVPDPLMQKTLLSPQIDTDRGNGGLEHDVSERLKTLDDTNQALMIEIKNRQELLTQLQQDLEDANQEILILKAQGEEKEQIIVELEDLCQSYQEKIDELYSQLDAGKRDTEILQSQSREHKRLQTAVKDHEEELVGHKEELAKAQAELSRNADERERIRAILQSFLFVDPTTHNSLADAIKEQFEAADGESHAMQDKLNRAVEVQEDLSNELRSYKGLTEQIQGRNKSLERNMNDTTNMLENLKARSASQDAIIQRLEKQLEGARQESNKNCQALENSLGESRRLLIGSFDRIQELLGRSEDHDASSKWLNPHTSKAAIETVIKDLSRRLARSPSVERNSQEGLQKQVASLEAQLNSKARGEEKTKVMLEDLKNEIEDLRQKKSDNLGSYRNDDAAEDSLAGSVRKASTSEPTRRTRPDDYWTLHERIKVLTRELKYQKELREQDDKAARARLAESKREKKDLMETVRRLRLGDKTLQTTLTIEGSESTDMTGRSDLGTYT